VDYTLDFFSIMYNILMLPSSSPLQEIEPRLRHFLPADLYSRAWVDTFLTPQERVAQEELATAGKELTKEQQTLQEVFEHLRTLQRILYDYTSRGLSEKLSENPPARPDEERLSKLADKLPPSPGEGRHEWQSGSLMFTDLAGFTKLMEANAALGQEGAKPLLDVLNTYFTKVIQEISKSEGDLLEFTGDALLILFPETEKKKDTWFAIRAGLRMQHEMEKLPKITTPQGELQLRMRVGIHTGRFLIADIGTPRRMEHVLLGSTVQQAKLAEGAGQAGRVNLSTAAYEKVKDRFRFEEGKPGYKLVVDDLSDKDLDDYAVTPRRRLASSLLFERKIEKMVIEISETLRVIELLGSFIPQPVLGLLVESAAAREIPADFSEPTVVFVNFIGLPELVDQVPQGQELLVVNSFSRAFAQINAAVEAKGGVLKKVTYHLSGSDMVIYFGVPTAHTDDPSRASHAALAIRDIVMALNPLTIGNLQPEISCQIGISMGPAFSAEIGEKRGRREFNLLGDTVNTTARIMNHAGKNKILIAGRVYEKIKSKFECEPLGDVSLKGKSAPVPIYELKSENAGVAASARPT